MSWTRIDVQQLANKVSFAKGKIEEARDALAGQLVTDLTADGRQAVLRAPTRLAEAARILADAATRQPALAQAADYDPHAVLEDLRNIETIAGLAELCREIAKWADDSQLVWMGEAYEQSLALYDVAKARARRDGSIRTLIEPIAEVFAFRRTADDEPPEAS